MLNTMVFSILITKVHDDSVKLYQNIIARSHGDTVEGCLGKHLLAVALDESYFICQVLRNVVSHMFKSFSKT